MTDIRSTPRAPVVHTLTSEQCLEHLGTASVGRVGFVTAQGLQIVPLNYRLGDGELLLSTTPNGSLSQLAEMGAVVTLEVDEHDASTGLVWSVMIQGRLAKVPRGAPAGRSGTELEKTWPGSQFAEPLRFTPHTYSGRLLEHPAS